MYNGAIHRACGGAKRWPRSGGDTQRPKSFGLRWKRSKAARRLANCPVNTRFIPTWHGPGNGTCWKTGQGSPTTTAYCVKPPTFSSRWKSTSCSVQSRPHSPKCTLFFPFRVLTIGANHRELLFNQLEKVLTYSEFRRIRQICLILSTGCPLDAKLNGDLSPAGLVQLRMVSAAEASCHVPRVSSSGSRGSFSSSACFFR